MAMKTPPHRIAAVALIVLLLAGAGAWWWRSSSTPSGSVRDLVQSHVAASPTRKPPTGRGIAASASMDALIASCNRAVVVAFNERALQLRGSQDAQSQVAYALAVPLDPSLDWEHMPEAEGRRRMQDRQAEAASALQRAVGLAPEDLDVLWLAATRCNNDTRNCRNLQEALLAHEPDNMAVWMREISWAKQRNDEEAARLAFSRAAAATHYDTHSGATHEAMMHGYAGLPMPAVCERPEVRAVNALLRELTGRPETTVETGMLDHALLLAAANAAATLPSYNDIRQPCLPGSTAAMTSALRESCKKIHARLSDGDTLMDRIIGTDVMVQLAADTGDAAEWRERYRRMRWMMEQQATISQSADLRPEDYATGEMAAYQAALEAMGRWPPPADWLPSDKRARSLILTGRAPEERRN